jgi:hypothetical protein
LIVGKDVATDPRVHEKELQKNLRGAKGNLREVAKRSESGPLDPEGHVAEIHMFQRKGTLEERGEQSWEILEGLSPKKITFIGCGRDVDRRLGPKGNSLIQRSGKREQATRKSSEVRSCEEDWLEVIARGHVKKKKGLAGACRSHRTYA